MYRIKHGFGSYSSAGQKGMEMSIFEKLGFKSGINACGTVTRLGGTRLPAEVTQAMADAGRYFIPMHEFHRKAGEYVAGLLGVEACCITCGAAAGLAVSAAACMTRGEQSKIMNLPDTAGMPDEILMLKSHRILYVQALRLSGAAIREVGTTSFTAPDMLEPEINDRTALFVYVAERETETGSVPLPDLVPILKKHSIPIVVDAAAELPPAENIKKYIEKGADLVAFSGGKEVRGPQASGLLIGCKEFIDWCHANCCPNYSIGRSMKISKETVAGLVAAVELFVSKDYKSQMDLWESIVSRIFASLVKRCDVQVKIGYPTEPGVQPVIIPRVYIKPEKMTAVELQEKLLAAATPVYVDINKDKIVLNPQCLEHEEADLLIDILHRCLDDE